VGAENVTAQVTLQLDFTQEEITTEDFDQRDKGPKTRSELYVEDRNTFKDAIGIPGSLTNTPPNPPINPAATDATPADPNKGVSEKGVQVVARSTKNYELDRAVRHTKSAMGNISKLVWCIDQRASYSIWHESGEASRWFAACDHHSLHTGRA
jgi:flagellar M-ring protein FliF